MKRVQEYINFNTRREGDKFICGAALCPVCEKWVEVAIIGERGLGFVTPETACIHTDMAVDAGAGQIAVMFRVPASKSV